LDIASLLSAVLNPVLAYFVVILMVDIALGVGRSLIASFKSSQGHRVAIGSTFDWGYLANFAKSQLLSPPVLAVGGAILLAYYSGANSASILAVATAAAFFQSVILTRDIILKIRGVASLLMLPSLTPTK
jgi:hypothetical protein